MFSKTLTLTAVATGLMLLGASPATADSRMCFPTPPHNEVCIVTGSGYAAL